MIWYFWAIILFICIIGAMAVYQSLYLRSSIFFALKSANSSDIQSFHDSELFYFTSYHNNASPQYPSSFSDVRWVYRRASPADSENKYAWYENHRSGIDDYVRSVQDVISLWWNVTFANAFVL